MQSIPQTTQPFFQEYDFKRIDPDLNSDLIIERILAFGNREEVRWLLNFYGEARIQHWLSGKYSLRLPLRRYRLWCTLLNVVEMQRNPTSIWPY